MATDKKIPSNLIFNKEKFRYNTIQDVINDTGLTVGLVVETDGYNTLGDGFDAKYLITNVNEQGSILLKNGNYAKEINNSNGSNKLDKVNTIEELKSQNLKVGDIIEVLGYYQAGDGAGHKRKIESEDDGSGVLLSNGLYANIVHNGEVNVSWLGAKNDGTTDDTLAIQKACSIPYVTVVLNKNTIITGNIQLANNVKLIGNVNLKGDVDVFKLNRECYIDLKIINSVLGYSKKVYTIDCDNIGGERNLNIDLNGSITRIDGNYTQLSNTSRALYIKCSSSDRGAYGIRTTKSFTLFDRFYCFLETDLSNGGWLTSNTFENINNSFLYCLWVTKSISGAGEVSSIKFLNTIFQTRQGISYYIIENDDTYGMYSNEIKDIKIWDELGIKEYDFKRLKNDDPYAIFSFTSQSKRQVNSFYFPINYGTGIRYFKIADRITSHNVLKLLITSGTDPSFFTISILRDFVRIEEFGASRNKFSVLKFGKRNGSYYIGVPNGIIDFKAICLDGDELITTDFDFYDYNDIQEIPIQRVYSAVTNLDYSYREIGINRELRNSLIGTVVQTGSFTTTARGNKVINLNFGTTDTNYVVQCVARSSNAGYFISNKTISSFTIFSEYESAVDWDFIIYQISDR